MYLDTKKSLGDTPSTEGIEIAKKKDPVVLCIENANTTNLIIFKTMRITIPSEGPVVH
jgi:hypothetical protein